MVYAEQVRAANIENCLLHLLQLILSQLPQHFLTSKSVLKTREKAQLRTKQPLRLKSGVPGQHLVKVVGQYGQEVGMQQLQLQLQGNFRLSGSRYRHKVQWALLQEHNQVPPCSAQPQP